MSDPEEKREPGEQHRDPAYTPSPSDEREPPEGWEWSQIELPGFLGEGALLLAVALILGALAPAFAQDDVGPFGGYPFLPSDRLLAAQAAVHEAGFGGLVDAGGIIQVVMERRREDERFEHALARTMPHFYPGETSRSWARALPSGPIRRNPPGWDADLPARVYNDAWRDLNEGVHAYMAGALPMPFETSPVRWFGPITDSEQLADALADGWCRLSPRSGVAEPRNAFLVRCEVVEGVAEVPGTSSAGPPGPLAPELDTR